MAFAGTLPDSMSEVAAQIPAILLSGLWDSGGTIRKSSRVCIAERPHFPFPLEFSRGSCSQTKQKNPQKAVWAFSFFGVLAACTSPLHGYVWQLREGLPLGAILHVRVMAGNLGALVPDNVSGYGLRDPSCLKHRGSRVSE